MTPHRLWRAALATALVAALVPVAPVAASAVVETSPIVAGHLTGDVTVGYVPAAAADVVTGLRLAGARIVRRSGSGVLVVSPPAGIAPDAFAASLAQLPGVRYAEPVQIVRALWTPDDPEFAAQWGLARIGAPAAWDVERGEATITVAVVDSGVDLDHPDLEGRLDTENDYDFVSRDSEANDEQSHGTHVAGIIAAVADNARDTAGVAPGCVVLPVRVLDAKGAGDDALLAEGIRYAADHGADVINVSAGGPDDSRVLADAVEYAVGKDCVIVAAAGNKGGIGLDYPAASPDVLSVGAIDKSGAHAAYSQSADALDVVAPGTDVVSLLPAIGGKVPVSTGLMSGTSMASPHVAGVAALLRSANPTWTAAMIAHRITDTAEDLGPQGDDPHYGHGLLRADRALGSTDETPAPPGDDELPGTPLSRSPVSGVVDAVTDPVDVYSVDLAEGQILRVWLKGASEATISATLIDPLEESVAGAVPLETIVSTGTSAGFTYETPEGVAGRYRIAIRAEEGGGEYSLAWLRGHATEVLVSAPKTCAWGGSATIEGSISGRGEELLRDASVLVDAKPAGAAGWTLGVATGSSGEAGYFRIALRPARRTAYRVRFRGIPGEIASTSRIFEIAPRAALTPPMPTSDVRRGEAFSVAGTLRPEHPVAENTVKITVSRLDASGRWIVTRTVRATNLDRDRHTRYTARLILGSSGTYRIVASVSATSVHAATTSRAVRITVP